MYEIIIDGVSVWRYKSWSWLAKRLNALAKAGGLSSVQLNARSETVTVNLKKTEAGYGWEIRKSVLFPGKNGFMRLGGISHWITERRGWMYGWQTEMVKGREQEIVVGFSCQNCDAHYELEADDLWEIAVDGEVTCECGSQIDVQEPLKWIWSS